MYTVKDITTYELEIKKSKFIGLLYRVNNIKEVDFLLNKVKTEYKDATHYCFAYILDSNKRSSDDNEPSNTAGLPILQVLEKQQLNYILCVVIRYFGGIKLGAGGLTRAYTKTTSELIKNTKLYHLIDGYRIKITINYNDQKQTDYLLRNYTYTKQFNNNIEYQVDIPKEDINKLPNINIEIIDSIKILKNMDQTISFISIKVLDHRS